MHLFQRQIFGTRSGAAVNTYIGGVAATYSTAALLATKLGISSSRISNFSIVGSNIQCGITGTYAMPSWVGSGLTYYKDLSNLVTSLGSFQGSALLVNELKFLSVTSLNVSSQYMIRSSPCRAVILPYVTSVTSTPFYNGDPPFNYERIIYLPRCTNLGGSVANTTVFGNIESGTKIYVDPILATNNAGAPDGDLTYAIGRGCVVKYVTDFTIPSSVTDTTNGTIYSTALQLNFTPPSSTNAIDFYEVWVNDFYYQRITAAGDYIYGLTASTNYNIEVRAVDIYYNVSVNNNILNVSTNTASVVSTSGLVSYYRFNESSGTTVNDSYGSNAGTNNGVTLNATGIKNTAFSYNGTTDNTSFGNPAAFQLSTGSLSFWVKSTNQTNNPRALIAKTGAYTVNLLYGSVFNVKQVCDGVWHHVVYNFTTGTNNSKVYVDGVLCGSVTNTVTTQANNLIIASAANGFNGVFDELAIYNRALTATEIKLMYNNRIGSEL